MVNSIKIDVRSIINSPKIGLSLVLFLVFQSFFSIDVSSYYPAEDFAINCSSPANESQNPRINRTWRGDMNSTQFVLIEPQNNPRSTPVVAPPDPSSSQIPYGYARLSHSEFTYSFQVTEDPKFVRLYFKSAQYPSVQRYNALFSVEARRYTLLKDFNASLTTDNDEDSRTTVFREYCINFDAGQRLNITFTPSPNNRDAYAFINGIEIVSMPTELYCSEDLKEMKILVQEVYDYHIRNSSALQTMYRINVGGSQIRSENDAGLMFRFWDDEIGYLEKVYDNSQPAAFAAFRPKYTEQVPNYTAPDNVYLTARSYGRGATSKYNVTWNFRVGPQFIHVVRLHFCEFEPGVPEENHKFSDLYR